MRQALHIFQKDVRYLWREVCLLLALAAMLAWAELHSPGAAITEILWMLAAGFTIARVVHAEAIPGHNQFWTTRPYRWESLLGAKIAFILLFVNLPLFVAQAYMVQASKFPLGSNLPGLLWSQVLMLLCLSLPITALAAMTAGIAPFLFSSFILLTVGFVGGSGMLRSLSIPLPFRSPAFMPASVEWVKLSFVVSIVASAAIGVVYLLYRTRQINTGRILAVGGALLAAVVYFYTTSSVALAVQSRFSHQSSDEGSLKFALDPSRRGKFPLPSRDQVTQVELLFPIAIEGFPQDVEPEADAVSMTIQGVDGKRWSSSFIGVNRQVSGAGAFVVNAYVLMDPVFFRDEGSHPVSARASLYLTVFGNPASRTIPVQARPVDAVAGLRCGTGMLNQLYCRSVFRWPRSRVYAQFGRAGLDTFTPFLSYSPFPATLGFNPLEQHWVSTSPNATEAAIISKEPLRHFRRDIEFKDVRLTEFTRFAKH